MQWAPANALTNLIAFLPGILAAVPEFWQRHAVVLALVAGLVLDRRDA